MSNFLSNNPNIRRGIISAAALALPLGGAACSAEAPKEGLPPTTITSTSTIEIPTTTTTLSPEVAAFETEKARREAAEAYVTSPERNARIDALVQETGQRFIAACETGEAGPCDVYSGLNDQWRSEGGSIKAGWAWLQHGPQYGGKDIQFSATVWVNEDWTIDSTKGIKGIRVYDANGGYAFTAPGGDPGVSKDGEPSPYVVHPNSWESTVIPRDATSPIETASELDAYNAEVLDLQIVDETAISLVENFRQIHDLR